MYCLKAAYDVGVLPRTRPVSASPLSFVTAAVSSFSQISFYQSTYKNFVKDVNSEGILQL